MIMFRQLIPFHCLFAPSPEPDETIVFQQRLILDIALLKTCATTDSN